jgi:hypothetical protein
MCGQMGLAVFTDEALHRSTAEPTANMAGQIRPETNPGLH